MIVSRIVLAEVGGKRRTVGLGVVSTGEDGVLFILVKNIGIKESANTGRSRRRLVADVVSSLLQAGGSTNSGIVWPTIVRYYLI